MYTACYVLTDGVNLFYYNQLLISLSSLRKRSFTGQVCVVMDTETARILEKNKRKELNEFNAKAVIIQVPDEYSQKEKSRYLKTSLREYIEGAFLYIDTDTVIADLLPDNISDADLAMVSDSNIEWPLDNEKEQLFNVLFGKHSNRFNLFQQCGYHLRNHIYYNGGVMWAKDTPFVHAFFSMWHSEWKKCRARGVLFDQPSLNHINWEMGDVIVELSGIWNVQICANRSIRFLNDGKIIHYYNNHNCVFLLSDKEIQKLGYNSETVTKIINSPKNAFSPWGYQAYNETTEDIMICKAFSVLQNLYLNHRKIYRGINFLLSIPSKIKKKVDKHNKKAIWT